MAHIGMAEFLIVAAVCLLPLILAAIAVIIALVVRANRKPCPYCGEKIAKEATLCRYCGRELPAKETAPAVLPVPEPVPAEEDLLAEDLALEEDATADDEITPESE